ncbi:hypothetical protein [[Mycoplasma] gypis]|uniref:Uncharacterized protein n=1 Tax=[Mycoplasma] gypis TaxID=92404 RepID=A0ABZ2RNM2_9BACT|nr:hypothetical protein [[Mycoplasma] gypis]MBN0919421.1 hypothetical protein [[Mycoplasma] gypis]
MQEISCFITQNTFNQTWNEEEFNQNLQKAIRFISDAESNFKVSQTKLQNVNSQKNLINSEFLDFQN